MNRMLNIMLHIFVYYIFSHKKQVFYTFSFWIPLKKGGSRFTTGIFFQNLRQALNLLENGDILRSWWQPEIR